MAERHSPQDVLGRVEQPGKTRNAAKLNDANSRFAAVCSGLETAGGHPHLHPRPRAGSGGVDRGPPPAGAAATHLNDERLAQQLRPSTVMTTSPYPARAGSSRPRASRDPDTALPACQSATRAASRTRDHRRPTADRTTWGGGAADRDCAPWSRGAETAMFLFVTAATVAAVSCVA
eukprot:15452621-Alexandrium_andersonii.AAC.2